ncbi:MAG: hypothetical protein U9R08_03075 [Nanoarchaeota archaeon]|nr:hypothetical protein [Nanoarchaeota archaeon]
MRNLLTFLVVMLGIVVFVSAQYPVQIYGTLSQGGNLISDGTKVDFMKGGNVLISTTTKDARYGYEEPVFIDGEELTIGDVLSIIVNGNEVYDITYLGGADLGIDLEISSDIEIEDSRITGAVAAACITDWKCSDWSACINNIQTRDCIDSNNCGTNDDKPIDQKDCEVREVVPVVTTPETSEPIFVQPPKPKNYAWILYVVMFVIIGLIAIVLIQKYRYTKHAPNEQPHRFIHFSLKEGHDEDKIKQKLTNQGWQQQHVEDVVQLEKLRHYIIDELRKGVDREQLIKYLVDYGWDIKTVEGLMPR